MATGKLHGFHRSGTVKLQGCIMQRDTDKNPTFRVCGDVFYPVNGLPGGGYTVSYHSDTVIEPGCITLLSIHDRDTIIKQNPLFLNLHKMI